MTYFLCHSNYPWLPLHILISFHCHTDFRLISSWPIKRQWLLFATVPCKTFKHAHTRAHTHHMPQSRDYVKSLSSIYSMCLMHRRPSVTKGDLNIHWSPLVTVWRGSQDFLSNKKTEPGYCGYRTSVLFRQSGWEALNLLGFVWTSWMFLCTRMFPLSK